MFVGTVPKQREERGFNEDKLTHLMGEILYRC